MNANITWPLPKEALVVCVAGVLYTLGLAVYRLFISDLARFPGPKLAAITYFYEFYYDAWPYQGRYEWKIRELHEKYGALSKIHT